ncbi:polyphosphate polymerase domain-containing protein [Colwellia sp. 6_MG-2023]|uniref:polyphosphate polymerase domain-containing protein n=1 Tax=Colwellia sp. 6_MG-2023 TaxID=3062676 RepID=UPI0026E489D6|nr:polyphosphate polymerase domain-containing protein [Colwellia sp. 6_MG-2023]MDO6488481.1 polyphosphate polymerase domain-containing protein [Colwellia sp. 6_MG-2023]
MEIMQPNFDHGNNNDFFQSPDLHIKNKINIDEASVLADTKISPHPSLEEALSLFNSHGLNDLDAANLMNRVDSKFILPLAFLPDLLIQLKSSYTVLEINSNRVSSYHNQYFDTPNMSLYHDHHNGKLNRYKVRRRRYVDTNTEFLEVKLKNNKKRTIKSRIKLAGEENEYARCAQFIDKKMHINVNTLDISQQGGYKRIALANEAQAERLTLDFDLWYQDRRGNNNVKLPGFFIAELKQNKKSKRSLFYQLMSTNNIFPTSFSKYCIGCALLYNTSIKSNQFKAILSHIEKLNRIEQTSFLKSN